MVSARKKSIAERAKDLAQVVFALWAPTRDWLDLDQFETLVEKIESDQTVVMQAWTLMEELGADELEEAWIFAFPISTLKKAGELLEQVRARVPKLVERLQQRIPLVVW